MEPNLEKAKEAYQQISIPEELDLLVDEAMIRANHTNHRKSQKKHRWWIGTLAATLTIASFTIGVNTNDAFAQSVGKIPIVREFAKLVTIQETHKDMEVIQVDAVIPAVEGIGDKALEERINAEIQEAMNSRIEEARQRAAEYKQAFVETGGDPDAFHSLKVDIGYTLMSVTESRLSFEIYSMETMASAYTEYTYYNIDLDNNKMLTLEELLGADYRALIAESVKEQVAERMKDSNNMYFEEEVEKLEIHEDQAFYINNDGKPVIVFKKYEISPGYMGKQEFVMEASQKR